MNKDGKNFEQQLKKSINNEKMYYLRLKDSPSSFGCDSASVRFTLNNPYDCFVFYNGFLFPIELKSTELSSISIQRDIDDKGKMIKINQIKGLLDSNKYNRVFSGFLFDFRSTENTYWLSIDSFNLFLSENDKKSINEKDVIKYKGIIVEKTKKRTQYVYDIEKLLLDIIEICDTIVKSVS